MNEETKSISKGRQIKNDVLSGLTVALALVPEAVAFAFVAGVDPFVGLYAAFFMGFITAAFGGRPGMISGATGAMAVVMTVLVADYGVAYLFVAVILAGIWQVIVGLLKLGRFIRILPHPVMLGFVNGLAIVIGLAQFGQFKTNHRVAWSEETGHGGGGDFVVASDWMSWGNPQLWTLLVIVVATMLIIQFLPKLTKAVPASLAAIVIGTLVVQFTPIETQTVADVVNSQRVLQAEKELKREQFHEIEDDLKVGEVRTKAEELAAMPVDRADLGPLPVGLKAGLPTFQLPEIDFDNRAALFAALALSFVLAAIGLIESLMTLSLIDEITETRGSTPRECIAQGAGNIVSGFFGGMGGCAMIGQSMINIRSGGRGRLSGISAAVLLLAFIVTAPKLIEMIPVASLIGVMFMVVIATFSWSSLRLFGKVPKSDILVIIVVSAVTVLHDLAIAVLVGVLICALVYAWERSKDLRLQKKKREDGRDVYEIEGNIYFGTTQEFRELFQPAQDPEQTYLSFARAKVCDQSAIEAIHSLSEKYRSLGKRLYLRDLSPDCVKILRRAGDMVDGEYFSSVSGGH